MSTFYKQLFHMFLYSQNHTRDQDCTFGFGSCLLITSLANITGMGLNPDTHLEGSGIQGAIVVVIIW